MEHLRAACKAKLGATETYVEDWSAFNYKIGGKMLAIIGTDGKKKPLISLKCDVGESEILRQQYEDIVPGYYLNKQHWNSIYYDNHRVPIELIEELIDHSYSLIWHSLPKKKRADILKNSGGVKPRLP
ncbi:MmcQ/YjbR family DNA-binding protein [Halalkalibacterium halodurans]|uniref:MmcQ/YjbR family DNA-binding protein n=1 Tax=Halalkalibacterium halodurans TaxID=86665 RepID=UPI002AA9B1C8|nr:MmcQ/YjbR family DNA-binding protein [Halalkalibacterium halodurans]MDY7222531.1 MmcQ/YjbR family DNA-binding protein [Halalkalibacterium halodurans]MDY7241752.1 MmcQ/YjbR family DNA-binding protein [Halalkalibacterium halodurans]